MPSESSRHSLPPGLAAWLQQVCLEKCENRQFEEGLAQVCGAVSKAEEEELCSKQLELVIGKLSHPGVSASTMADCMVRIIHMAHLGYDTSPSHIHCVKLAGAGTILQRKMGQFFFENSKDFIRIV